MDTKEMLFFIGVIAFAVMLTRFLPFIVFHDQEKIPKFVKYLGKVLPFAVSGFLVVYCLKDVGLASYPFGIPELISICFIVLLYLWKKNSLLAIVAGTACYMVLVNLVFI